MGQFTKKRSDLKRLTVSDFDNRSNILSVPLRGSNKFEVSGHNYAKTYAKYLNQYRYKKINLLEIGVLTGSSLCVWASVFPYSRVYGIDLEKFYWESNVSRWKKKLRIQNFNRINFIHGDIYRIKNTDSYFEHSYLDIIIDDGPHTISSILKSFELFHQKLKCDGIYIVEDNPLAFNFLCQLGILSGFKFILENGLIIGKRYCSMR